MAFISSPYGSQSDIKSCIFDVNSVKDEERKRRNSLTDQMQWDNIFKQNSATVISNCYSYPSTSLDGSNAFVHDSVSTGSDVAKGS